MKSCRFFLAVFAVLFAASCSQKASVDGTLEGAGDREVVVRLLEVNSYKVLDTLKTSPSGQFSFKVDVPAGQPEFVYLFYGPTRVASLLLERGDRVKVSADTLGHYTVEGSEESSRLAGVEADLAAFASEFTRAVDSGDGKLVAKTYLDYYRSAVKYVVANPYSLTCIPVLYQQVAENLPLFSQDTDAIHFRRVCDSLKTVYPDSKYVKALEKETVRREQYMNMSNMVSEASEVGFPELNLPNDKGVKVSLAGVEAKAVMVHFWSAADAEQKMFNLDVLKPVYEKYHSRGFEIYAVCVDTDKASWAATVKAQQLPWINVCDGLGASSTSLALYNVRSLPTSILIADGELVDSRLSGEAGLRKVLDRILR